MLSSIYSVQGDVTETRRTTYPDDYRITKEYASPSQGIFISKQLSKPDLAIHIL